MTSSVKCVEFVVKTTGEQFLFIIPVESWSWHKWSSIQCKRFALFEHISFNDISKLNPEVCYVMGHETLMVTNITELLLRSLLSLFITFNDNYTVI